MLQQATKFWGVTFFWSYFDMGKNKSQTPQISSLKAALKNLDWYVLCYRQLLPVILT